MDVRDLKTRVAELESKYSRLEAEVQAAKSADKLSWQRALEKFADNQDLLVVFADATKQREADRQKAHQRKARSRKS